MLKRIIYGAGAQFFGMAVSFFDRFVVTALLLRYWGVGLFEDWSLLVAAVALFGTFGLGFHNYFGNAYLFDFEQKKHVRLKNTIRLSIFFNLSALIVGSLVLIATGLSIDLARMLGIVNLDQGTVTIIFLLLGLMILLSAAGASITELYRAQGQFGRGVFINALLMLARSSALGGVVILGAGPLTGALVFLGLTVLFVFVIVPLDQKRSLPFSKYGIKIPDKAELTETWHGSKWFFVQTLPALLLLNLPVLLIGFVKTEAGIVAAFVMSRTIINFARQVLQNFTFVLSQEISRLYARNETERVGEMYMATNRFVCTLTGAMLGCLLALSEPFFALWSGGIVEYHETLMVIFALTVGLAAPATAGLAFLFYIQQARPIALARTAQAIISLSLAFILVRPYGAIGVAFAMLAGEVIGLSFFILPAGVKASDATLSSLIGTSTVYLGIGFLPCYIVGWIIKPWFQMNEFAGFFIGAAVLSGIFLLVVAQVGLGKRERQKIWGRISMQICRIR
jgi:O-antigen/teichoic acid export membrane protein